MRKPRNPRVRKILNIILIYIYLNGGILLGKCVVHFRNSSSHNIAFDFRKLQTLKYHIWKNDHLFILSTKLFNISTRNISITDPIPMGLNFFARTAPWPDSVLPVHFTRINLDDDLQFKMNFDMHIEVRDPPSN